MIRWALFTVIAVALAGYAYWIYLRVDLAVPAARRLAAVRAIALVAVLALLFDARLPAAVMGGPATEWVLLDASLSMAATDDGGGSAWDAARARAGELGGDGWHVATFGADPPRSPPDAESAAETSTLLAPALRRAAEAGARRVRVLSDNRFEDAVAVRAALATLPLEVSFESFGGTVANAGIGQLEVDDVPQRDQDGHARLDLHGGGAGDTLTVEIFEEDRLVATVATPAPDPGLRTSLDITLPPPATQGRVRYSARVAMDGDAFGDDDEAVDYAVAGRQEGALVVLSLMPDWEPRHLLPVLRDVTGLPTIGYLRAGPDRYVQAGRAVDRGAPVDSATVRQAVVDAAILVVHGLTGSADDWVRRAVEAPGRKVVMVRDVVAAGMAGVEVGPVRSGEWYASPDLPPSAITSALAGVELGGLPPLDDVLAARSLRATGPMVVQLRGTGEPEPAMVLDDRPDGRVAVVLSTGYWRWAMRDSGREAYRRLWSGVAGWLLADQAVLASEARPQRWVVPRGERVAWSVPGGRAQDRLVVTRGDSVVLDTVFGAPGAHSTPSLEAGRYAYRFAGADGDSVSGRFDVASTSGEMLPVPSVFDAEGRSGGGVGLGDEAGTGLPLRTLPWPYLLIIGLLCTEWVGRRRSGLR